MRKVILEKNGNLIKIQIINHRIVFIVSSRVGWFIIGGPGSEKMVGGMSTFLTGSGQAVCQQWRGIRTRFY